MRITTEKIYCDICGKEIKNNDDRVNVLPPSIEIKYTETINDKYNEVCYICIDKIKEVLNELNKDNDGN